MAKKSKWTNVGLTQQQAAQGRQLDAPGSFIVRCGPAQIVLTLGIDPDNPGTEDDKYSLYSPADRSKYSKTLTPKDDAVPGDSAITLEFGELPDDLSVPFFLEIDPGAEGEPFLLFQDVPGVDLVG